VKEDYFEILRASYRELIEIFDPINKDKYLKNWREFDNNCFEHPETIGKCAHITKVGDKPIGLWSYDPRNFPEYGIVGHNCILPKYRRNGYGKKQIQEMLNIFKENGCKEARVTTTNNEFFIPAQKMYESLGFRETKRYFDKYWGLELIDYNKDLI
jgi:GNAT superfamily N-acetyltransferase